MENVFLFLNLSANPKKSTPGKLAYISYFQRIEISATRLEKTPIHFKSDIFAAVTLCRCQKSLVSTVVSALRQTTCQKVAKESALFVHDKRGEQISVDITSWGFIRAINLPDADVDDRQDKTRQDIYYRNITSTIVWHAVSKKTLVEACQINSITNQILYYNK